MASLVYTMGLPSNTAPSLTNSPLQTPCSPEVQYELGSRVLFSQPFDMNALHSGRARHRSASSAVDLPCTCCPALPPSTARPWWNVNPLAAVHAAAGEEGDKSGLRRAACSTRSRA